MSRLAGQEFRKTVKPAVHYCTAR